MDVVSLGFRTDLMVRRLAGSVIIDRGGYLIVRTPANPGFWWGNFLLFPGPPAPADLAKWPATFASEFPGARHVAIGVDGTGGDCEGRAEIAAIGLDVEVNTVLTARRLAEPARPTAGVVYRPVASDGDWEQTTSLSLACDDSGGDPGYLLFAERRQREARELCRGGHGAWFGAFVDGHMRSGCGVFTDGSGLARYQNVQTDPGYRRRGLASHLVYHAGRYALTELGATTLVIVADPADSAIRVYRSLGFADAEHQVQLQRESTR